MGNRDLKAPLPGELMPHWRVPKVLLTLAVRSSSVLGHQLVNQFTAARFQLFILAHMAMWAGAGVALPVWEYFWILPSIWYLVLAAICAAHCVVLAVALRLARRGDYQRSITLVCIGTWIATSIVTFVFPGLLPVMVLVALVPVVFAEPYMRWQQGLVFTVITGLCVLAMAVMSISARFMPAAAADAAAPRWVGVAFIVGAVPVHAFHLLVIVWNNAAALRTSEGRLAERAAELTASRTRLATAADEERRRIERDLHDGAQQHLVALSVLLGLARNAEPDQSRALLAEASELVETSIVEIRRLAHGIYPALLISGGLPEALPTLAARSAVPAQLDLHGVGRYPAPTEAALYYCCSEALQNATKHGGPGTTVTITARDVDGTLTLVIADTGRGFDPALRGHGLVNMTDRLSSIGGTLAVDSAAGRGTRIVAVVTAAV